MMAVAILLEQRYELRRLCDAALLLCRDDQDKIRCRVLEKRGVRWLAERSSGSFKSQLLPERPAAVTQAARSRLQCNGSRICGDGEVEPLRPSDWRSEFTRPDAVVLPCPAVSFWDACTSVIWRTRSTVVTTRQVLPCSFLRACQFVRSVRPRRVQLSCCISHHLLQLQPAGRSLDRGRLRQTTASGVLVRLLFDPGQSLGCLAHGLTLLASPSPPIGALGSRDLGPRPQSD